jgi:hypothetical protein
MSPGPTSFSALWPAQNATWARSRKRCFKGRLDLRTHFLHSGAPNTTPLRGQENDVSRIRLTFEIIFSLLSGTKNELCKVEKAKLQRVAWFCEIIFASWPGQRTHFLHSEWSRMRLGRCRDSVVRLVLSTHFLPRYCTKTRLDLGREKMFQGVAGPYEIIFCRWPTQNGTCRWSIKRCYNGLSGTAHPNSAFYRAQNSKWLGRESDVSKVTSHTLLFLPFGCNSCEVEKTMFQIAPVPAKSFSAF